MKKARVSKIDSKQEPHSALPRPNKEAAQAVPLFDADEPVPDNMDEFRAALTRKIMTFLGMPRRCRVPLCRRSKTCSGRTLVCQRDHPSPEVTPERMAAIKAALLRALRESL